jgi:hypothetical protein
MRARLVFALLAVTALLLVNPARAQDDSALVQRRTEIREMTQDALAALFEAAPGARTVIEHAAGYGVFSTFGIKIFFAGGTAARAW